MTGFLFAYCCEHSKLFRWGQRFGFEIVAPSLRRTFVKFCLLLRAKLGLIQHIIAQHKQRLLLIACVAGGGVVITPRSVAIRGQHPPFDRVIFPISQINVVIAVVRAPVIDGGCAELDGWCVGRDRDGIGRTSACRAIKLGKIKNKLHRGVVLGNGKRNRTSTISSIAFQRSSFRFRLCTPLVRPRVICNKYDLMFASRYARVGDLINAGTGGRFRHVIGSIIWPPAYAVQPITCAIADSGNRLNLNLFHSSRSFFCQRCRGKQAQAEDDSQKQAEYSFFHRHFSLRIGRLIPVGVSLRETGVPPFPMPFCFRFAV